MPQMNCGQAELLSQRYLDREITIDEYRRFQAHLRSCPRCLDDWLAMVKAVDLISALPQSDCPSRTMHAEIMMKLPPERRLSRFSWQAAAAILVIAAVAGAGFLTGSRQLTAAVVEIRNGRTVVVPKPGRPLVIPPGAVIQGNLYVKGDVHLHGGTTGRIDATGRTVRDLPIEPWHRLAEALSNIWRGLRDLL